jgi:hypothetical protein
VYTTTLPPGIQNALIWASLTKLTSQRQLEAIGLHRGASWISLWVTRLNDNTRSFVDDTKVPLI